MGLYLIYRNALQVAKKKEEGTDFSYTPLLPVLDQGNDCLIWGTE